MRSDRSPRARREEPGPAPHASESVLRQLIELATSGLVVYEPAPDGNGLLVREFNAAAERLEQRSRDTVVGRPATEALPRLAESGLLDVMMRVARTGEPEDHPDSRFEGERLLSSREHHVSRLPSGEIVTVTDDVTERDRARLVEEHTEDAAAVALARAKDLLDRAEAVGHTGGWEYDVAANRVTWTDETYRIHGVGRDYDPSDPGTGIGFCAQESESLIAEAFGRCLESGEPVEVEAGLQRAIGEPIWVSVIGQPVVEDGRVTRVTGTITEITARRRAEEALRESERRLRRFYDAGLVGIMFWNTDGRVTEANDRFLEMIGYTRDELEAGEINWVEMTPPESRHLDERLLDELMATGVTASPSEKEYLHKDGTRIPIVLAGAMLDDERHSGIAFALDITERKQAEIEIQRLNTDLERRVDARTSELSAANAELEQFVHSIAHDLRSPLRALAGFSELVETDYAQVLDDTGRDYLRRIHDAAGHLGELMDALLSISRVGRLGLSPREVDLTALARQISGQLREDDPGRAAEIEIEDGLVVRSDQALCEIILENLLGNAWKFSAGAEPARISLRAECIDGAWFYCVRDNGVGFDSAYADKLFRPFERLHTTEEFPGTGIGLATVRRAVTRLGGRCWAAGEPGAGASVYFSLGEACRQDTAI